MTSAEPEELTSPASVAEAGAGRPSRWQRVLLKVSGEAFAGDTGYGIAGEIVEQIAREIVAARSSFALDVAVVVGGGNIWRGRTGVHAGMDRAQADYMGMLATVINALAIPSSPPTPRPRCGRWRSRPTCC
jgi:hypothetical protein